jgi:hypothetical protein
MVRLTKAMEKKVPVDRIVLKQTFAYLTSLPFEVRNDEWERAIEDIRRILRDSLYE